MRGTAIKILLAVLFILATSTLRAQVEGLYVETYYISDSLDSTDPVSGTYLSPGTVTYRIYVDLAPSSELLSVYGDAGHALEFSSTAPFFNHASGDVVPYLNAPLAYQEFTLGLDSWITLGQIATRNQTRFCGVTKPQDTNGNGFAGNFNDGGMLSNNAVSAGIPLTVADGMDTMDYQIGSSSLGFFLPDSSIFGPGSADSVFSSHTATIQCDGARGNDTSNLVLVAQLTTLGEIAFRLNLQVKEVDGIDTSIVNYVSALAPGEVPTPTLIPLPQLVYPPVCGCTDPRFVEYNASFTCSVNDSCRNLVRYGCTDTAACNYDPSANFNLPTLCCYPGYCNDRDLALICPSLLLGKELFHDLAIGPNPFDDVVTMHWSASNGNDMSVQIIDSQARVVKDHVFHSDATGGMVRIATHDLSAGLYFLRITDEGSTITSRIVKQ